MKRSEPMSIANVLEVIKERQKLSRRLDEHRAMEVWDEIAGSAIASETTAREVRDGVMYLTIPSAALRQELNMHRSTIMEDINRLVGREIIRDLRFI